MSEIPCDADGTPCRSATTDLLDVLGRKYAMEVVCVVANHESIRFGRIEDHLPEASTSTLSVRLDELAAAGVVGRRQFDEVPPRVEYALTDDGLELAERLRPVVEWIAEREDDEPTSQGDGDAPSSQGTAAGGSTRAERR